MQKTYLWLFFWLIVEYLQILPPILLIIVFHLMGNGKSVDWQGDLWDIWPEWCGVLQKQAHKLGRCDSYLGNLKLSITHSLTHSPTDMLGNAIASKNKYIKCTRNRDAQNKSIHVTCMPHMCFSCTSNRFLKFCGNSVKNHNIENNNLRLIICTYYMIHDIIHKNYKLRIAWRGIS